MAIHSSTLAWRIPWAEEAGRLQSMGCQRVRFWVEQGEEKLFEDAQGCAHPAVTIPGAEEAWSSGQAKPRGGSFCAQWKVAFLLFLPKPSFRKIALCSLFLVMLFCPVSCISPLSGAAKPSRVSFQPHWCSVVRGGRAAGKSGLHVRGEGERIIALELW